MSAISAFVILSILFILEILYFKIADHYNIIDEPNQRSSHTIHTIRGGGIIFALSALMFFYISNFQYPYFILGLTLIAGVSFLDDIFTLNKRVRLLAQTISVALLFLEWSLFSTSIGVLILFVIGVIGIINAYNFMDGINGMTGLYSLITILCLYYINEYVVTFTSADLLVTTGLSLVVFVFFNFRKTAKCFAGDVGSVGIAFILIYLIGQLILETGNTAYILLLLFYGLDTGTTILFRLIRKENVFEAHRSHFYQYLVNEQRISHLYVSIGYAVIQLVFNIFLIYFLPQTFFVVFVIGVVFTLFFIILRFSTEGKNRLLKHTF